MSRPFMAPDEEPIRPADYVPPQEAAAQVRRRRRIPLALTLLLAALAGLAWFLFGARIVEVHPEPPEARNGLRIHASGSLDLAFGNRVLLHDGLHVLEISSPGYVSARQELQIDASTPRILKLALDPLPGRLQLGTTPVAATVSVDGTVVGSSNADPLSIAAGEHRIRVEAPRFLGQEVSITITGRDELQTLDIALAPGWGSYEIGSEPPGAEIFVDDESIGNTPARIELERGTHHLRLHLDGHRDTVRMIEAVAGEERTLDPFVLERADARLRITTRPAGASITIDGEFQGRTPLELAVDSSRRHEITAFKAGYERASRTLAAGIGSQDVDFTLQALSGEVRISVTPPDARVVLDGRELPAGTRTLTLPGVAHVLRVERAGHAPQEVRFTPRPGLPQRIQVTLQPTSAPDGAAKAPAAREPGRVKAASGLELVLLHPQTFTAGSSRREVGRRANETLHEVRMQRPFYLAVAEVSNAEFRRFRPTHDSGEFKGKSLGDDDLPVVNVSWEDAALYCNWLSAQDGLPPFYKVSKGHVTGFDPASRGYRLPSEAEWAWAAGVMADGSIRRFGWGDELPPPARAANIADRSGASLLGEIVSGYDDGFPVAAPRRRFTANRHGIFDLDGNASEWVNDVYEPLPSDTAADPLGAQSGELHAIRGASWRDGTVTTLRLAFRDYGKDPRPDLGFRIARYAE